MGTAAGLPRVPQPIAGFWDAPMIGRCLATVAIATLLVSADLARAQAPSLRRDPFPALLADPREPRPFASYVFISSARFSDKVAPVGLGYDVSLWRSRSGRLRLGAAAGIFAQFNMSTSQNELVNTDFLFAIPVTYRHGAFSARARLYHLSSHVGDEFLVAAGIQPMEYSFDAVELLVAAERDAWRLYSGGEYSFHRRPTDLAPAAARVGLEFRDGGPLIQLPLAGSGRLVAALDAKLLQARDWKPGWSLKAGLDFGWDRAAPGRFGRWSVLLEAYRGPAPFGQFYIEDVSWVGFGVHFGL